MSKLPSRQVAASAPAPKIAILVGSRNDFGFFEGARSKCESLGIAYEIHALSAHRTPEETRRFVLEAEGRGIRVLIAGAGAAAHLAGVVASHTTLPVIGVPLNTSPLLGLDSLLSTVQMPEGIPVATMAIGAAGASNAVLFAAAILALNDRELAVRLKKHRADLAARVLASGPASHA
jgi:phosphoribosylaminoimidazole carboxylase PurE protein